MTVLERIGSALAPRRLVDPDMQNLDDAESRHVHAFERVLEELAMLRETMKEPQWQRTPIR